MKRPPYLRHPRWRSLSNAFMVWLARQDEIVRAEVRATKRQGRVILAFARFPTLSGWVRHNCLAVYANGDNGEYFDQLLDFDSLPIRVEGTQTFVCGFCEGERQDFDGREALWADHLFEPFADWVRAKLRQSDGIEYYRSEGFTSARLRLPEDLEPVLSVDAGVGFGGTVDHFRSYRQGLCLQEHEAAFRSCFAVSNNTQAVERPTKDTGRPENGPYRSDKPEQTP